MPTPALQAVADPRRKEPVVTTPIGPSHVIEVRNLCKTYDSKVVIDDLSFTVEPGVVMREPTEGSNR